MIPTIEYLQKKFHEFNALYFDGELITPKFELFKSKRTWGQFCWSFGEYKIRISIYYDRTEENICNTLIHEMIHEYIRQNNIKDTRPHHGRVFFSIADRINKEGGWHIKRCSSDNEYSVNEELVAKKNTYYLSTFYVPSKNAYYVISMNKNYIAYFKQIFKLNPTFFLKVKFFTSNDTNKWGNMSVCRKIIRGNIITEMEYNSYN